MRKEDIAETLVKKFDLPKSKAREVVETVFEAITNALVKGEEVVVSGFGKFYVAQSKERQGINPKTGEKITIPAKKTPKFRAGKQLKEAVK